MDAAVTLCSPIRLRAGDVGLGLVGILEQHVQVGVAVHGLGQRQSNRRSDMMQKRRASANLDCRVADGQVAGACGRGDRHASKSARAGRRAPVRINGTCTLCALAQSDSLPKPVLTSPMTCAASPNAPSTVMLPDMNGIKIVTGDVGTTGRFVNASGDHAAPTVTAWRRRSSERASQLTGVELGVGVLAGAVADLHVELEEAAELGGLHICRESSINPPSLSSTTTTSPPLPHSQRHAPYLRSLVVSRREYSTLQVLVLEL